MEKIAWFVLGFVVLRAHGRWMCEIDTLELIDAARPVSAWNLYTAYYVALRGENVSFAVLLFEILVQE